MTLRRATRAATVAGWAAVVIGVVHVAFTGLNFERPSLEALWFAGSGIGVMLIGAITLMARRMPARGLAVAANAAGLLLAVAFGMLTEWREPQGPILVVVFVTGALGTWMRPTTTR